MWRTACHVCRTAEDGVRGVRRRISSRAFPAANTIRVHEPTVDYMAAMHFWSNAAATDSHTGTPLSVMQRLFSNAAQPRTVSRNGLFRSVWVFATFTWSDCLGHLSSDQILAVAREVQLTGLQVMLPSVNSPCMQSRLCCLS